MKVTNITIVKIYFYSICFVFEVLYLNEITQFLIFNTVIKYNNARSLFIYLADSIQSLHIICMQNPIPKISHLPIKVFGFAQSLLAPGVYSAAGIFGDDSGVGTKVYCIEGMNVGAKIGW